MFDATDLGLTISTSVGNHVCSNFPRCCNKTKKASTVDLNNISSFYNVLDRGPFYFDSRGECTIPMMFYCKKKCFGSVDIPIQFVIVDMAVWQMLHCNNL